MELWVQLKQAGQEPVGLGPLPQALRMAPPEGNPGQTLLSSGTEPGGATELLLLRIWEELGNLRRIDAQLLGQLCKVGLEMEFLREELVAILEEEQEEQEEEEESCVEEENKGPRGRQEDGHSGAAYPAQLLPDFEMTI